MLNHSLWDKTNYTDKNIRFINGSLITEYDISSAGMNILMDLGLITKDKYNLLKSMKKLDRNVAVGMLLKDKEKNKAIEFGFKEARRLFMENNNLEKEDILSIKKDAIYLIDKDVGINGKVSKHIEFKKKKTYSSYIRLINREHYLPVDKELPLDVKGYSDYTFKVQKDYLFNFLKKIMLMKLNNSDYIDIYLELLKFKDLYITNNLPVEYYFDLVYGMYVIEGEVTRFGSYGISEEDKDELFKNNNLLFILELINTIL